MNSSSKWPEIGTLKESFELEYLNPYHHNYPAWPGGERWLSLVKSDLNTEIIFTDGLFLADSQHPFELYLETDDEVEDLGSSWQASLVYEVGRMLPTMKDLASLLPKYKYITIQLSIDGAPDEWSLDHPDGNIGVFAGLENPALESTEFPFIPLNVKLMRPQEMQYVLDNGSEGRLLIRSLYAKQGNETISNLERESVI